MMRNNKYKMIKCQIPVRTNLNNRMFVYVSVSGWTGMPQMVCLFHKGDQILAINDLHTSSVEEVNKYLGKCLKNEVRSRYDDAVFSRSSVLRYSHICGRRSGKVS